MSFFYKQTHGIEISSILIKNLPILFYKSIVWFQSLIATAIDLIEILVINLTIVIFICVFFFAKFLPFLRGQKQGDQR